MDLGALPGQSYSRAFAINQKGDVVGEASGPGTATQPVVWQGLSGAGLPVAGWTGGTALGVNDKGLASGLLYSGAYQEAALWKPGDAPTLLPAGPCPVGVIGPCASQGYATSVNSNGDAAGESAGNATIWEGGGSIRSLAADGVVHSVAWDINDDGTAVGWFDLDGNGAQPRKAFVWAAGQTYFDLGAILGGEGSQALAINKKGQVVGWVNDSASTGHAFLWSLSDGLIALPLPGGAIQMVADGINDHGEVVGMFSFVDGTTDGFLWSDKDGLRTLSGLIPASGWTFIEVHDINDKGQIVGEGISPTGEVHAFLIDPKSVPEPGSLALVGLGLAAGLGFGRQACRKT
jgi:probable HAF family extracellular repeat protein